MFNFSENYRLREFYLKQEQVPTLSMIKKKMTPALAAVYFKSMKPRIKELAGLEPPLKGAGGDWFQPPEDLLNGRAVLKPVKKKILSKLNNHGIAEVGTTLFLRHRKAMDSAIELALLQSDNKWRNNITATACQLWDELVAAATKRNTEHILRGFNNFTLLYRQSMAKIEILFHESAITEIKNTRENAIHEMKNKYKTVLKHQATLLYDEYEKKLKEEKNRLKLNFMKQVELIETSIADKIHDINVDKHMAIESLRQCLLCQNLACGVYVALKEREECSKETEILEQQQKKKVDIMSNTILMKDFEIHLAVEREKKREEFRNIWRKKVCYVVKSFQMFVSYCLHTLPEYAEFFINMEKLMLLQLNKVLDDPSAASIIEEEREEFQTPVPRPKPFYLFCNRGYKADVEQDLCPKHSGTSSASGLPVVIVNKRCIYAACDNFEQFTNKIKEFIHGNRGDDADFKDDNVYEHFFPVKYGSSQQRLEIKLESSLLQILKQELANLQLDEDKVPVKCNLCEFPWCIPCPHLISTLHDDVNKTKPVSSSITSSQVLRHTLQSVCKSGKLDQEREPKWQSFCKHVEPKKCSCAKTAKKHLAENLPVYMRHMKYGPPEIPGYKMCSFEELKTLVKEARGLPSPSVEVLVAKTKDVGTQYCDEEYEILCTCFADTEARFSLDVTMLGLARTDASGGDTSSASSSYLTKRMSSFALSRAQSLRNLLGLPEIKELFTRKDCAFE